VNLKEKTMDGEAHRFFGGPPGWVLLRLVLLSVVIGVVLAALGVDPFNLVESLRYMFHRIFDVGFDLVRWLWRYFVLGAVLVFPIWLILRVVERTRAKP
jgi:hypothetical protein